MGDRAGCQWVHGALNDRCVFHRSEANSDHVQSTKVNCKALKFSIYHILSQNATKHAKCQRTYQNYTAHLPARSGSVRNHAHDMNVVLE